MPAAVQTRSGTLVVLAALAASHAGCPRERLPAADAAAPAREIARADAGPPAREGPPPAPSPSIDPLARIVRDLEAARSTAGPAERRAIDRAITTFRESVAAARAGDPTHEDLVRSHQAVVGLLRELGNAFPDDPVVQVQAASSIGVAASTAQNLDLDPEPLRQEHRARVRTIVERFPTHAPGWSLLAHIALEDRREIDGLTAVRRCLEIDPVHAACRELHRVLTAAYERPRCLAADLAPDLRLDDGTNTLVARGDVVEASAAEEGVTLRLTAEAARRVKTRSNTEPLQPTVVLHRGATVLFEGALGMFAQDVHDLNVTSATVERVCARVERRSVPRELALGAP